MELLFEERPSFVNRSCGGDAELLHEVRSLLRYSQLELQSVLDNRYEIARMLGERGFARAYLAYDLLLHKRKTVIKVPIDPGDQGFGREIMALSRMNHPERAEHIENP